MTTIKIGLRHNILINPDFEITSIWTNAFSSVLFECFSNLTLCSSFLLLVNFFHPLGQCPCMALSPSFSLCPSLSLLYPAPQQSFCKVVGCIDLHLFDLSVGSRGHILEVFPAVYGRPLGLPQGCILTNIKSKQVRPLLPLSLSSINYRTLQSVPR